MRTDSHIATIKINIWIGSKSYDQHTFNSFLTSHLRFVKGVIHCYYITQQIVTNIFKVLLAGKYLLIYYWILRINPDVNV